MIWLCLVLRICTTAPPLFTEPFAEPSLPLLLLCPSAVSPQIKDTPEAPTLAQANLKAMGPMSKGELITLATISGAVVLWMFGDAIGVPAVLAAMLALATLLCTGKACAWAAATATI